MGDTVIFNNAFRPNGSTYNIAWNGTTNSIESPDKWTIGGAFFSPPTGSSTVPITAKPDTSTDIMLLYESGGTEVLAVRETVINAYKSLHVNSTVSGTPFKITKNSNHELHIMEDHTSIVGTFYYNLATLNQYQSDMHLSGYIAEHSDPSGMSSIDLTISNRYGTISTAGHISGFLGDNDILIYKNTSDNSADVFIKVTNFCIVNLTMKAQVGSINYDGTTSNPSGTLYWTGSINTPSLYFSDTGINFNGKVGIGTNTPSANLHVVGNVYSTSDIEGALISATGQTLPLAPASEGVHMGLYSDSGAGIELISDSSTWGVIDFNKSPGATNYQQRITGGNGDRLDFYTGTNSGGGIRMAIDSDGDVGIGTTSPAEKLDVDGNIKASGDLDVVNVEASQITVSGGVYATGDISTTTGSVNGTLRSNGDIIPFNSGVKMVAPQASTTNTPVANYEGQLFFNTNEQQLYVCIYSTSAGGILVWRAINHPTT
tara:strand:+ start:167 stop:1627 length:1461 start_codon:yes stop_codon:yes gene_type:complete